VDAHRSEEAALRPLGNSGICVTPIAMGCWPIAGITSVDVTEAESLGTLKAACDAGINFFDTAYCYGYAGESERMVGRAIAGRRDHVVIATKGGIHWTDRRQTFDASPATLRRECEESLRRLGTDRVDLYYLHAPDPRVPVAESAGALKELLDAGKTRVVGVSNFNTAQLEEFARVCPIAAYQPHFNMLQREIEASQLPWCAARGIAVVVYWPLMKGLLAGRMPRNHAFDPRDGRQKYPMFHGEEWQRNQDFVDEIRAIADDIGRTVAQVVLNWTIHQPGITAALCGAKRPAQIRENAGAMGWRLSEEHLARIARAIERRGPIASRMPV
jgi:aryl-alcohol dehydrogenase-like predicted oxidoreductase